MGIINYGSMVGMLIYLVCFGYKPTYMWLFRDEQVIRLWYGSSMATTKTVKKVLLEVQEGYQWNSLKGLRFLEWCSSNVLAEFLVKVDDDVHLG